MRTRRRIALALCTSKAPLSESERSFIQSVVYNTRGDILKFGSNSFLFSLGARKTRESDIENCVSVCLAIREHISGTKFGVSYGLVSVDERKDGSIKIEGPITKKVKHLESISASGQVSTDDSITKIYSRIFDIRHVKVKGKDVHNIFGFKDKPSRIRGLREAYGKMIGRDKEFNKLQNFILQTASDHGMIVGVVGEAGIGKTRITHELKTLIKMRGLRFYEGSFPYFGGSSYKGFKDLISSIAGIAQSDPINIIEQKLRRICPKYGLEDADINFLVNLYSVIPVSETLKHLNEEQLRLGTFVAVKKLLFTIAENPLVIILEDMQNADELSVELANFLCEGIPDKKLLFFMNYRPEFKGKFEENVYFNRIQLERFDESKAKELLTSLLDISNVPKNLLKLIIKKSAGNPLFIEELVRSLLDKGKIKVINNELQLSGDIKAEDIQPTVHGVISYRMEKLDSGTRKVLQWAAAAGDEIRTKLVSTILGKKISGEIETLETRDFIVEKSIYPEEIYKFRHDLIREVAYESLSSSTKKNMHLKIGQYLEKKFKREIDEHVEEIANHYIESSDHDKGFEYAFKAAEKLKKNYSNDKAEQLFLKAADLLQKLSKLTSREEFRLKIVEGLTYIYIWKAEHEKALSALAAYRKALDPNDLIHLASYYRIIGEVYWRYQKLPKAIKNINRAIEVAEKANLRTEKIKSLNLLLSIYSINDDSKKTQDYADQLLSIIDPSEREIEANIYNRLGRAYLRTNASEFSIPYLKKSAQIFESLKDFVQLTIVYDNLGSASIILGDYEVAISYFKLALKMSLQTGNVLYRSNMHNNLANAYIALGMIKNAYNEFLLSKKHFEETRLSMDGVVIYSNLCWMHVILGDYSLASEFLNKSNKLNLSSPIKIYQGTNLLLKGMIEKQLHNYPTAIHFIREAIQIFEDLNAFSHKVEALSELADIYYRKEDVDDLRQTIYEIEHLSALKLSALAKEKSIIAKIKAEIILQSNKGNLDLSFVPNIDKFDWENKFELYITLAKYFKTIIRDDKNSRYFMEKAKIFYQDIVRNTPDAILRNVKDTNPFRTALAEFDRN
jgi:predicted ATPase